MRRGFLLSSLSRKIMSTPIGQNLTHDQAKIAAQFLLDSIPDPTLTLDEKFAVIGACFQHIAKERRALERELNFQKSRIQELRDDYVNRRFSLDVRYGNLKNQIKALELAAEKKEYFDS